MTDSVKGLGKVNNGSVEVDILFLIFFLPGSKYNVSGFPFLPEVALVFWKKTLLKT